MKRTFEEISISLGDTSAKIAPERGGIVTSLSVNHTEILYLDRDSFNDITQNVRGGIPLLFPNAGPLKGSLYNLPQHGFARKIPWNVIAKNQNSIIMQLLPNEETSKNYPFDFELKLKVEIANNKLTHSLTVKNRGEVSMPTAYGIHPYFKIRQEEKQNIITNIENFNPEEINWMKEFDKAFTNPGVVIVHMHGKEITIESDPNIFKFTRIWHLAGRNFICIEPWTRDNFALDNTNQSLWIKPNEPITMSITIDAKIIK